MSTAPGEGRWEPGEIPSNSLPSDGTFFGKFFKGELDLEERASTHHKDVNKNEYKDKQRSKQAEKPHATLEKDQEILRRDGADLPLAVPAAEEKQTEKINPIASAPKISTKPPLVLKSKRPIASVTRRPGKEGPAPGKRLKSAEKIKEQQQPEPKFSYLKEIERYRQQACDTSTGDRPLVK